MSVSSLLSKENILVYCDMLSIRHWTLILGYRRTLVETHTYQSLGWQYPDKSISVFISVYPVSTSIHELICMLMWISACGVCMRARVRVCVCSTYSCYKIIRAINESPFLIYSTMYTYWLISFYIIA